ncbi:calcium-activated chloride channel regulator 1-like isoform X2 [Dermacentor andersoni]|uniref:calcium-activated chloride channel regulator 1-like isoform X2 n=1 Tax=Dermacentor andersoni TaxID=34620 RepID=UPI002155BC9A|nr:calcium-activated chloride channel regulator 1-like isoform X3 [Dermacentor andersoni]
MKVYHDSMGSQLPVATALLCLMSCVSSLEIDKTDGGYKDLLISINKDVPYNESIVENIKSLLRSSSEFLHRATNGRVYIKRVTIDFPNTWPQRNVSRRVSSSSFEKSDVRVKVPGSLAENRPFTRQMRPCGKPGDYIQLTPTFLSELHASTMKTFKNPAYVFVHEWAHYRYGVFDEYGSQDDNQYPLTYCEGRAVKLNSCSEKIRFIPRQVSGGRCKFNPKTCKFPKDCLIEFLQSPEDPVESSIMFMPYITNVSQFCDSDNGTRRHNRLAPNKQNAICRGKSTWEVISENEDFKNLPRPDMSKSIEVSFEETQQREHLAQRVVLVLDVSQSMDDYDRMTFLKEAATRYIQDIADGSKRLAIITFSNDAAVRHTLMPVNVNTRQSFLNTVKQLRTVGATCIGCGLLRALEVLRTPDETPEGGIIVLMSDGTENRAPYLNDVMPQLTAAKVEISTLALGSKADDKLEKLATATRGKAFFFQDLQGDTALRMETAFVEATVAQTGADKDYVTLTDVEKAFTGKLEEKFVLEPSLGNNTVVAVERVSREVANMTVTLIDPSGKECHKCAVHGDAGTKKIVVPSPAQSGEWTLRVHSSGSRKMAVNVRIKSQGRDPKDEPIRVTCQMGSLEVGKPDEAIIYADVSKGANVVLDATVVAEVTGPNPPHKSTVPLHDDGHDPDIGANDGTYSGYFVQFTGKGRYTVAAHVSSDHRARLSVPKIVSGSFFSTPVFTLESDTSGRNAEPDYEYSIDDFEVDDSTEEEANQTSAGAEPVGAFQRVASGGSFRVTEHIVQSQVPPGTIGDLTVVEPRPGANDTLQWQLVWTWPGAHLTSGNASAVEIRVSEDYAKLDSDFEQQEQITMADVVEGSLDFLPAGTKHVVTLAFSPKWATPRPDGSFEWKAFLAARVTNSDGLKSKTSNIVQVLYVPPSVTTTVATTTTDATTTAATTTEVTTTGVTTEATTPEVTTTEVTPTEAATTEIGTTTERATTTRVAEERTRKSRGLPPPWVWALIGGVAAVIVVATVLGVRLRGSIKRRRMCGFPTGRPRTDQRVCASDSALTVL